MSPVNVVFCGACWANAVPCENAGSIIIAPARAIPNSRRITSSLLGKAEKAVTLPYSRADKNGHHLVSKKHSRPRQSERTPIIDQKAFGHERLELPTEPGPHIDIVARFHGLEIDSGRKTQPGKQRLLELLLRR